MIYFDYHVHMGQFEEIYYNPYKVVEVLSLCGIKGAYISSTTSCISWNNKDEKRQIINHIIDECIEARESAKRMHVNLKILLWLIPQRYLEGESVVKMINEFPYCGFKIHPRAHDWTLSDSKICFLMDEICNYAMEKEIPIVIHTGKEFFETSKKFERWFWKYPEVNFQLAHCKDVDSMSEMLAKYKNVTCDIAMSDEKVVKNLITKGFANQIVFGSDFPITNYYMEETRSTNRLLLCNEYKQLLCAWEKVLGHETITNGF